MNDSISKFSYFLFSINRNNVNQGIGFFLTKNDQIYLVTASHNFFKDKTAVEKTADAFFIRLYRKENNKIEFFSIINDPIKKTDATKYLDINFYKVSIPEFYKLNVIDIKQNISFYSILCYGFGVVDGNEDNPQAYLENLKPTEFRGRIKFDYRKPIVYFENNQKDYDNYVVTYTSGTLRQGTSGAPVFSEVTLNGIKSFEFSGLIHLRNELTKIATILRPEKIWELLDKL